MKQAILYVQVTCCLVGWMMGAGTLLAGCSTPVAATRIIHYVPSSGVAAKTREGRCWTGSIAISRPDAWRCMVGNAIFDPCFAIENGRSVVCGASPETGQPGFRLKLEQPLPAPAKPSLSETGAAGRGWLVELADGTFCRPATGTMGIVAGQPTTYYCNSESKQEDVVLLGDLDAQQACWIAEKAVLVSKSGRLVLRKTAKVPVEKVWK